MIYATVEFADGTTAIREVLGRTGAIQRYCDADGNDIGRLNETPITVLGNADPAWALPDPELAPEPVYIPPPRRITKLAFVGRLGNDFAAILSAAKASVEVELFVKMLDWATPDPDGTSVDLDDPRVIYALGRLEQEGIIAAGRAAEILV